MGILIPEKVIKEELEILIKRVYKDLEEKRAIFSVNDAVDVNAGIIVDSISQSTATSPEITIITFPTGAAINGKHWFLSSPSTDYYVWYSTGNPVDPNIITREGIFVDVLVGDTADLIAIKTKTAIEEKLNSGSKVFNTEVIAATPSKVKITNIEINAERTSFLWSMFGGLEFDRFSYFAQMDKILKDRYGASKRKLTISLGWTQNREIFPHISIMLPSEEDAPKNVGIAQGTYNNHNNTSSNEKELSYNAMYSLFITSDNQNDVIVLYHFLKTLILMGYEQFSCAGLQNLYLSGRDITMDFELNPMNLYHRTVAMQFHYDNTVPDMMLRTPATGGGIFP